jgi:antiviral helicase SKI2
MVKDGLRSDDRAFWVLSLVSKGTKSGKEGKLTCLVRDKADDLDIKVNEIAPRWPPVLPKGSFNEPKWEMSIVDTSSISFVVNRIYKVSLILRSEGSIKLIIRLTPPLLSIRNPKMSLKRQ